MTRSGLLAFDNWIVRPDTTVFSIDLSGTQGIDVLHLNFRHPSGNFFRINIWDFGGQEIYHATHQFFGSPRIAVVEINSTLELGFEDGISSSSTLDARATTGDLVEPNFF